MPHECTNCGLTFPDGSKEMLSGCPDCGGNKFQFHPGGSSAESDVAPESPPSPESPSSPEPAPTESPSSPEAAPNTSPGDTTPSKTTDSSFSLGSLRSQELTSDAPEASESTDPPGDDASSDAEDPAQTSARSTVTSNDNLHESDFGRTPHTGSSGPDASRTAPEPTDDTDPTGDVPEASDDSDPPEASDDSDPPDISELREELNDQFESIKIHARGEYELNLMELYDREEHIIALQEDGRYAIDVPSSWREADEDD
jgi:predicted  nucleic acid-binding Zn-ribbon protein